MNEPQQPPPRIFLIRVTDAKGVTGYAVTEQVAFLAYGTEDPNARQVLNSVEGLFRNEGAGTETLDAIPFPAALDPHGRGYTLFASGNPPPHHDH